MKSTILAVIGAQYGSEGKGVIVNYLANEYDVHVRVGGPQAGHTMLHGGKRYQMRILPCGWTNPNAILVIGRGMLLNCDVLADEIEMVRKVDPNITSRVLIDKWAGTMDDSYAFDPSSRTREAIIGSTGEGVGAARVARIQRNPSGFFFAKDRANSCGGKTWELGDMLTDNTPGYLHARVIKGCRMLLEGTQGAGLSLIHGPWPYTTNHDTNAAQLAADIGLPPQFITHTLLVARTMPIRVASPKKGTSGPLEKELTWDQISERVGKPVQEITTVTKRIRRIGEWDEQLFRHALELNAPSHIAITFADYYNPVDEGVSDFIDLSAESRSFIDYIESISGIRVALIGTGGKRLTVIDRGIMP